MCLDKFCLHEYLREYLSTRKLSVSVTSMSKHMSEKVLLIVSGFPSLYCISDLDGLRTVIGSFIVQIFQIYECYCVSSNVLF